MKKTLIIGDLHFNREFDEIIFQAIEAVLKKHKPCCVILLGDVFNSNRVSAVYAVKISSELTTLLLPYKVYVIPGNHDYYDADIQLTDIFKNFEVIKFPRYIQKALFIPFTEKEFTIPSKKKVNYVFTHYDIFKEHSTKAFLKNITKKFISGHLHYPIYRKNIYYPGIFVFSSFSEANLTTPHYLYIDNRGSLTIQRHSITPLFKRWVLTSEEDLTEILKENSHPFPVFKRVIIDGFKPSSAWIKTLIDHKVDVAYKAHSDLKENGSSIFKEFSLEDIIEETLAQIAEPNHIKQKVRQFILPYFKDN